MAFTIRDVAQVTESGPSSSATCTAFAANPVTGDSILVAEIAYTGVGIAPPAAPTDTAGNSYAQIGSTVIASGDTARVLSLWRASNITGGSSFAVTGHWGGLSSWRGVVAWCVANNLSYNSDVASHETTGTNPTSGTTAMTPPGSSLFIAVLDRAGGFGSDTVAAGWNTEGSNGFTATMHGHANILSDSNVNLMTAYKISSSTEQASWTATSAVYVSLIASFSDVAGLLTITPYYRQQMVRHQ